MYISWWFSEVDKAGDQKDIYYLSIDLAEKKTVRIYIRIWNQ